MFCKDPIVEDLLALVEQGPPDETTQLKKDQERLRKEIQDVVRTITLGVSPEHAAPIIMDKEAELKKVEAKLNQPRPVTPDINKLRKALEERSATWMKELRKEPKVVRMILRYLIGPITLHSEPKDFELPSYIETSEEELSVEATAEVKPDMLKGLYDSVQSPRKNR